MTTSPIPYVPKAHQTAIINHIVRTPRCGIWAGMGLGKTSSVLAAMELVRALGTEDPYPVLVIAPLRVAGSTWPDEIRKWSDFAHLRVSTILGSKTKREDALEVDADIYTINYEGLPWLVDRLKERWFFKTIVADEATRLKSFRMTQGGSRARALGRVAHTLSSRFIALTGTPAPNGLQDLWGQMWFLDKGNRLGRSFRAFTNRWFTPTYDGWGLRPTLNAGAEIQALVKDLCISLNAEDYFDIAAPICTTIPVELPPNARKIYKTLERQMFAELESGEEVEAVSAAAKTMKCLQLASGAVYLSDTPLWEEVHTVKLDALRDVIEEAAGMPVLVAYHFRSDLVRLRAAFPKGRTLDKDPDTIASWNRGEIPVLFAHPASCGHGLNLQYGSNILCFFSHNWNLEEYQQIIERIGPARQKQAGLKRPVFVYHIVAKNTVDELVMERRVTKKSVQDILLAATKFQQL